ncbi:secreted protein [Bathymodiolus azoricus thioautotrophic gill symbiont]|uniref:Secreted protein n=1 Tax=Bathymodiolus azoricus thioautotrophic gill symbiont TaxID=235205 RepID=A0A1H6M9W9_9GAMM|nr:secreted protein [Bathymodiolus azoricus thioautotrophic gill symbiont]
MLPSVILPMLVAMSLVCQLVTFVVMVASPLLLRARF